MNGLENEDTRKRYVRGLVEELERAEQSGDKDHVAAVKRALADVGERAEQPAKRAEKRPAARKSTKR